MRIRPGHRRWLTAAALALVVGACTAAPPPSGVVPSVEAPHTTASHVLVALTRDPGDLTALAEAGPAVELSAPLANRSINSRSIYHRADAVAATDASACATVSHSGLPVQEGIALRVVTADGRTTAITVTKNIWAGAPWFYNVHVWDTGRTVPLQQLASFDMSAAIGWPGPFASTGPRLCARAVGDRVEFKVWRTGTAEPAWGDPRSSREVVVDDAWVHPGVAGWYIGHLPPGGWATAVDLTAAPIGTTDTTDSTGSDAAVDTAAAGLGVTAQQ
jgi:hypothetical protein